MHVVRCCLCGVCGKEVETVDFHSTRGAIGEYKMLRLSELGGVLVGISKKILCIKAGHV